MTGRVARDGACGVTGAVVVGVGARAGVTAAELADLIDRALGQAGLRAAEVTAMATLDRRAEHPALREVAVRRGWRVIGFSAAELSTVGGTAPSDLVRAAVGTGSVAEAAALLAAGPGGAELVVRKLVGTAATVAVARAAGSDAEAAPG